MTSFELMLSQNSLSFFFKDLSLVSFGHLDEEYLRLKREQEIANLETNKPIIITFNFYDPPMLTSTTQSTHFHLKNLLCPDVCHLKRGIKIKLVIRKYYYSATGATDIFFSTYTQHLNSFTNVSWIIHIICFLIEEGNKFTLPFI